MLASDLNNRDFEGAKNPDGLLHVEFYVKSLKNDFESEKQNKPVYYEADFIRIIPPGNPNLIIETFVEERHKQRFPIQWAAFQNAKNSASTVLGTPVEEWPAISRSDADELKAAKFYTVEQIANCSDQQIQALGMSGPMMRQKAKAFLKAATDTALATSQAAELMRKDQQIADLQAAQDRLAKQIQELIEDKPKRKYTKRVKNDDDASTRPASM